MPPSFYGKIRADGYDIGTDVSDSTNFYIEQWRKLGQPTPALEPMCGTGLRLIPFLEASATIDGLDSSPHMLAVCRQKLDAQGLHADLYEQMLEDMALPKQYAFIMIPDRSFGHVDDLKQAQACLQRIYDHLLPGGWFMLDLKCPGHLRNFPKPGESNLEITDYPDGSSVFSTSVWGDVEDGRVIRCWNKYEQYVAGKLVETEIFDYRERMYERAEFEAMLHAAGFTEWTVLKAYEVAEPTADDGLVFIAQKNGV